MEENEEYLDEFMHNNISMSSLNRIIWENNRVWLNKLVKNDKVHEIPNIIELYPSIDFIEINNHIPLYEQFNIMKEEQIWELMYSKIVSTNSSQCNHISHLPVHKVTFNKQQCSSGKNCYFHSKQFIETALNCFQKFLVESKCEIHTLRTMLSLLRTLFSSFYETKMLHMFLPYFEYLHKILSSYSHLQEWTKLKLYTGKSFCSVDYSFDDLINSFYNQMKVCVPSWNARYELHPTRQKYLIYLQKLSKYYVVVPHIDTNTKKIDTINTLPVFDYNVVHHILSFLLPEYAMLAFKSHVPCSFHVIQ
jgi:hypothetical protein